MMNINKPHPPTHQSQPSQNYKQKSTLKYRRKNSTKKTSDKNCYLKFARDMQSKNCIFYDVHYYFNIALA